MGSSLGPQGWGAERVLSLVAPKSLANNVSSAPASDFGSGETSDNKAGGWGPQSGVTCST